VRVSLRQFLIPKGVAAYGLSRLDNQCRVLALSDISRHRINSVAFGAKRIFNDRSQLPDL
jgi:hypothetical protein